MLVQEAIKTVGASHPDVAKMISELKQESDANKEALKEQEALLAIEREKARSAEKDKQLLVESFSGVRRISLGLANVDGKAKDIALATHIAEEMAAESAYTTSGSSIDTSRTVAPAEKCKSCQQTSPTAPRHAVSSIKRTAATTDSDKSTTTTATATSGKSTATTAKKAVKSESKEEKKVRKEREKQAKKEEKKKKEKDREERRHLKEQKKAKRQVGSLHLITLPHQRQGAKEILK